MHSTTGAELTESRYSLRVVSQKSKRANLTVALAFPLTVAAVAAVGAVAVPVAVRAAVRAVASQE